MFMNFQYEIVARRFVLHDWPTTRDRRYVYKDAFNKNVVGFCLLKSNLI